MSTESVTTELDGKTSDIPAIPSRLEETPLDISDPRLEYPKSRIRARVAKLLAWAKRSLSQHRAPAFLISIIIHTVILLALALTIWVGQPGAEGTKFDLHANLSSTEEVQRIQVLATDSSPAAPATKTADDTMEVKSESSSSVQVANALQVQAPRASESATTGTLNEILNASAVSRSASFASTGVSGRNPARRLEIAKAQGGSVQSEEAVENGLAWIANHQRPNGSFSLVHSVGKCDGRCRNDGSPARFDTAATGLSLLAFLGAGYTHKEGKYRDTVRKAVYFLLQVLEETPEGGSFLYQCDRGMYNHGIAAFALCEAYQLTGDNDLKQPSQQCIDFIKSAQTYRGGWGYLPKKPGDLTLSGWQIMALKSAYAAGLDVPPQTILRIDNFLDSQQMRDGVFYGYRKPEKNPTCTAIGQLIRLFRGRTHSDPTVLNAAAYLTKRGPSKTDAYENYYASLFLFHIGEPFWSSWNPAMREYLVSTQAYNGHEKGSWYFDNPYGKEGGRLYTTAMCVMTLEVYYRFAPLYQQVDVDFEL